MSKLLACPDCGEASFSWIIKQVQFGSMHEFDGGRRDSEVMKMGQVLDTDLQSDGPYCTECEAHKDVDDLVPIDEGN